VTDREVLKIRTKKRGFDRELNVISVKNGQSERVTESNNSKKEISEIIIKFLEKIDSEI
jgi:replicative DNA helicase